VRFNLDHLDYFHDIIYLKGDSTSTTSTTSTTTREASLTNTSQEGLGCTGKLVHHHYPVLVREFEDIAASIDDEHFSYIDS
jgi:hypothetical protein